MSASAAVTRERVGEAWRLADEPARMQQSTDAAIAALHRAHEFITGDFLSDDARADLTTALQEVEDLARRARLLVAGTASLWQLAGDLNGQNLARGSRLPCPAE